jgi:hypothetical protein
LKRDEGEAKVRRMDVNALRTWGIAVSSALMVGALALAAQPSPRADAQGVEQPVLEPGGFEIAQAPAQAAPVAFLVRFQGSGPIARAQTRAARGQTTAAQRSLEAQLRRQSAFSGLCFDRFTVGAAEVVLRSCEPVAAHERASYQARWLARLQAMRAVAYADGNATASPERAG